jgi:parvulin-like peptidyl-prolyl isomerase
VRWWLTVCVLFSGCTREPEAWTDDVVARVNGTPITKSELVRRAELTPSPGFHRPGQRNRQVLDILIDEMVVSRWAEANDLDKDPDYRSALDFVRKQALIRELYFDQIRTRAAPDTQAVEEALRQSLYRVSTRFLFTSDEQIAQAWREALRERKPFERLTEEWQDEPAVRSGDQSFHWGDGTVPPPVEEAAYRLAPGEVSGVIQLPTGFVVVAVQHRVQDVIPTPYDRAQRRDRVRQVLQARQETVLANRYVDQLLTPLGITQKAQGFQAMLDFLMVNTNFTDHDSVVSVADYNTELPRAEGYELSLPVVVTPDFTWDGREVLSLLRNYHYPLATGNRKELQADLTRFLKIAVRDHYLAERALELGLETRSRVQRDLATWGRYFLFLKGVSAFRHRAGETTGDTLVADWLDRLREQSRIEINSPLLRSINLTGIPMLTVWNTDVGKQLVVPPLLSFREKPRAEVSPGKG